VDFDQIVAIGLIVLGILVLVGELGVGFLLPILGIVLVVLGVLMLVNIVAGGTLVGVLTLVAGLLLYLDYVPLPDIVTQATNLVVGVFLLVLGVLQLT
jgi:hypothetical protein